MHCFFYFLSGIYLNLLIIEEGVDFDSFQEKLFLKV